jgi:small subunit ribosomal protein S6
VQKYECVFILRADQPEAEMSRRVERVGAIVGEHDGKITLQDHWGVRKLAYEIEKQTKGDYMLLRFESEGPAVAEIDRYLRQDDQVLRHLVVVDEEWEERNRVAMAKRRQNSGDEDAADNQE